MNLFSTIFFITDQEIVINQEFETKLPDLMPEVISIIA